MSHILLTGGAGFIGSHLGRRLLLEGHDLTVIDNFNAYYDPSLKRARVKEFLKDCEILEQDIADLEGLQKIFDRCRFDSIVHLAAQAGVRYSFENPFAYEESNLKGTLNLLELSKDHGVKHLLFASSSSVYGANTNMPFCEADQTDSPLSLYAATKKATELMCYSYHHLYQIPMTGVRFFTVYGPWGRPDMALFQFTEGILRGTPITVHHHGKMKRDFTFIDDAVDGVLSLLGRNKGFEICNIASGNPVELMKFIALIEERLGKEAQKNFVSLQPGEVLETFADISKIKAHTGREPKVGIEKGVEAFGEWYKSYYDTGRD